jgi:hypothetical protein
MPPLRIVDDLSLPLSLIGLLTTPPVPLATLEAVPAQPGFYALLYQGPHRLYRSISGRNIPIYVGSAERLTARLGDHARSIDAATNLHLDDFTALAVPTASSVDARVAEIIVQQALQPVWCSSIAQGFGSRRQGSRRESTQLATRWDTIHPGRTWAGAMTNRDPAAIAADVIEALREFDELLLAG